jgi:hypothetical protein
VLLVFLIICDNEAIHSVVIDIYFQVLKFYLEYLLFLLSFGHLDPTDQLMDSFSARRLCW